MFPIKQSPACTLKWSQSTIWIQNGITASCYSASITNTNSLKNFHNTPEKIRDRTKMLQGEWPGHGCQKCQYREQAGQESDRTLHNRKTEHYAPELDHNPESVEVTPTILEVYFSNECNMKCITCGEALSSQWAKENREHGRFESDTIKLGPGLTYTKSVADQDQGEWDYSEEKINKHGQKQRLAEFWQWMKNNHLSLKRLNILGGEPFYQKNIKDLLEFYKHNPNPELQFSVTSNLNIDKEKFGWYIDKFVFLTGNNNIKNLQIVASIDNLGISAGYIRHGLDILKWYNNFNTLCNTPDVQLGVNSCISALNIPEFKNLVEMINNSRKQFNKDIWWSMEPATHSPTSPFLHPKVFGHLLNDFYDAILQEMDPTQSEYAIFDGWQKQWRVLEPDIDMMKQTVILLNEMDRRRNTVWQDAFPEIRTIMEKCGILK